MNETEPADEHVLTAGPPGQPLQGILFALLLLGVISVGVGFVIGGNPGTAQATSIATQAASAPAPAVTAPPVRVSPPTTSSYDLVDWVVDYLPPFQAVQADMTAVSNALGTYSPTAITRACARMAADLDDLAAVPDAPDSTLARHNANLVGNFRLSAEACMVGDYDDSGLYMELGTADMKLATQRMGVLTGQ